MHLPPADAEKVQGQVTQAATGATLLVRPGTIIE
jgi:hypothetical protein